MKKNDSKNTVSPCFSAVRRGFTLVELLVVITIIGILMGLMLPAVGGVREAARQLTCRNNIKQLAYAVQSHSGSHNGRYPTGGYNEYDMGNRHLGTDVNQPGGWVFNIMDYADLGNLRNTPIEERAIIPVPMFHCPSLRKPDLYVADSTRSLPADGITFKLPAMCAKIDYAGNTGSHAWVRNYDAHAAKTGIFFYKSNIYEDDITDGAGTTCLLGEKYLDLRAAEGNGSKDDWGDNDLYSCGRNQDTVRAYGTGGKPLRCRFGFQNFENFGSAHAQGSFMAMCDGSVVQIKYTIDTKVYENLTNRADGNLVGTF